MAGPKKSNDEVATSSVRSPQERRGSILGTGTQKMFRLQALIIVLLVINIVLLLAIWLASQPAVISLNSQEQIVLDIVDVDGDNVTYGVYVYLKNTGGAVAHVSATGEVLVSLYGSAYGEEVQKVLDYASASINPGEGQRFYLGNFYTYPGWHYVVRVHVSWNGGTLELSRLVV